MPILSPRALRSVASLILVLTIPPATGWAWYGSDCHIIDGYTRSMWARTWNAQNSVTMPVSPYFIPRTPAVCKSIDCTCGEGCPIGEPNQLGAYPYTPAAAVSFDPVQFERLGRVPNELSLGSAVAAPVGVPTLPAAAR